MSFKDLNIELSYRTKKQNPVAQFFEPVLREAAVYNVAVGYFSSAWIRDNSYGIANFAAKGGKAKWIVSPFDLSPEDRKLFIDAYSNDYALKAAQAKMRASFDQLYDQLQEDVRIAISWLIRDGILDFRMGVPVAEENENDGILHTKMGFFVDRDGNELSFSGSYNLTGQARYNWERFDVFKSWESETDKRRTAEIKQDLEAMWNKEDPTLIVFEPTEETLQKFRTLTYSTTRPYTLNVADDKQRIQIPKRFLNSEGQLRPYQETAIAKWFKQNGRGIFHMATGSGKTATALSAITRLHNLIVNEKRRSLVVIVSVPFVSLAEQWIREAKEFNFDALACFGSRDQWFQDFQLKLQNLLATKKGIVFVVAVNRTLAGEAMQSLLTLVRGDFLFVGDEMHNLGAQENLSSLPNANFRMGLSATPDREYDEEGTKQLQKYFGDEVIEFTLEQAIKEKFLCRYYYFPILVELTDTEWDEYIHLTEQISQLFARGQANDDGPSPYLQTLIFGRARLLGKAENKIKALKANLQKYTEKSHMLIYCGDAKDGGDRQVDIVTREITLAHNMRLNKFTSEEDDAERETILTNFANGNTQALVAIKCLDEGIDVPKTETAFILASSTTKRQFIQRRGRVLRKAAGKEYAFIYDFIAIPRLEANSYTDKSVFNIERKLFTKELNRINEFATHSINSGDSLELLRPIKQRLNLMNL